MVDAFIGTTGNASVFHVTALDLALNWYLARNSVFRQTVTKHPVDPAHNYKAVTLTMYGELAPQTATLSETVNPDSIDIAATRQVTVTMNEKGLTLKHTLLGDVTSWNGNLPADLVKELIYNATISVDLLVRTVLDGATNVFYRTTGDVLQTADPGDATRGTLNAKAISAAVTNLRTRRSRPMAGSNFLGIIHPDVAFDVRVEAGANTWHSPHVNVDTGPIYSGVTGSYAGADFIETDQCQTAVPTADTVYTCYFVGHEAVLEASKIEPHIVVGEVTDPMRRIMPVSWHGLLGHSLFRQNSVQLVKVESGLGAVAVNPGTYDPKA
jgi:N4-gp56 family major capsid protein